MSPAESKDRQTLPKKDPSENNEPLRMFVTSPGVRKMRLAHRLQRSAPGNELVEHRVEGLFVPGVGLELAEILEVGEQGEHDLGADGGDHEFGHDQAKVFDGSRAADTAIADETGGLIVP